LITSISVRNFGCFDDTDYVLNLKPETFIIGPNNVGKSTFFSAYALIVQRGSFYYPLTKFNNMQEASFGLKKDSQIRLAVAGEYARGVAESLLLMDVARNSSGIEARGHPDAQGAFGTQLATTWFLTSDRIFIPYSQSIPGGPQPVLDHRASNVIAFLLERWTSRDPNWPEAELWLRKIDPSMELLISPLRGTNASIETRRKYVKLIADVNVAFQGGGIQRALQIIAAIVFSPKGSVIMIEEPEMNLHKETQEILVDLFNKAVNEWEKQIIVTTHSWDMILPFISDIGKGSKRGADHVKADPSKFKLVAFSFQGGIIRIEDYDIRKEFDLIKKDFKLIWG